MKITLAENIRSCRKERSMTQEQLAQALGVSYAAVSKWERGVASPDLDYIVEMANMFGVSVDALLGYEVQNETAKALEEQIYELQQSKRYDEAAERAEKALPRYPNSFGLVYRCGELYQMKGIESNDTQALERAIALLQHAVSLLPQNTDPEISEVTIQSEIAVCYIGMGEREKAIALLEQYNYAGVYNDLIGLQYVASEEHDPEKAAPYLMKAYGNCLSVLVRTMTGYANYYARHENPQAVLEVMLWIIGYMESIKQDIDQVAYVDKLRAPYYTECGHQAFLLGRPKEAESYLRKGLRIAKAYDAAPVYNAYGIKFCIGTETHATAYDDIGKTALDAIADQIEHEHWPHELRQLWEKLKAETV